MASVQPEVSDGRRDEPVTQELGLTGLFRRARFADEPETETEPEPEFGLDGLNSTVTDLS